MLETGDNAHEASAVEWPFIHLINLDDWLPCWNTVLRKGRDSPEHARKYNPELRTANTIYSAKIDDLRLNAHTLGLGVVSPWSVGALTAAMARSGLQIGMGVEPFRPFTPGKTAEILAKSDVEIEFEAARRNLCPDAPSRLSALYVCENNTEGRLHLRDMFSHVYSRPYVMEVRAEHVLRFQKCDTKWFEEYCKTADPKFIENYWSAVPYKSDSYSWEYLIEGFCRVKDSDLEFIRTNGARYTKPE